MRIGHARRTREALLVLQKSGLILKPEMDSILGDEQTLRVVGRSAALTGAALHCLHYAYASLVKRNANANFNSAGRKNAEAEPNKGTRSSLSFLNPGTKLGPIWKPGFGPMLKPDSGAIYHPPLILGSKIRPDFGGTFRLEKRAGF